MKVKPETQIEEEDNGKEIKDEDIKIHDVIDQQCSQDHQSVIDIQGPYQGVEPKFANKLVFHLFFTKAMDKTRYNDQNGEEFI